MNSLQVFIAFAYVLVVLTEGAASNPSSVEQTLKPYLGVTYRLTKSDESLSDVFEDLGYTSEQIQDALKRKPTLKLTEKSKTYTLERKEGGFGDFTYSFVLSPTPATDTSDYVSGRFFDQDTSVKMTQEENVLTQVLMFTGDSEEVKTALLEYAFSKDELKLTITTNRHRAVQTYAKEG